MPGLSSALASLALVLFGAMATSASAQANVVPRSGGAMQQADSVRAAHVLSRLTFGARPGDLEHVLSIGVERWIQEQLHPESIADSASQTRVASMSEQLTGNVGLLFTRGLQIRAKAADAAKVTVVKTDSGKIKPLQAAANNMVVKILSFRRSGGLDENAVGKVARSETSERQLLEVVTDFWLNHFSVYSGKMPSGKALTDYENSTIRPNAMGKFRDLIGAVAHSPAMLFYLDNHLSGADAQHLTLEEHRVFAKTRTRPVASRTSGLNENYARELLELHSLGVDGGYSQNDIIEVARAFTGWSISAPVASGVLIFNESLHDAEEKTVLGAKIPAGGGMEDGERVLDMVARHPATARFIARKLVTRFVSDSAPESLVARAAETFTRTDGDIREVVATIITSPEFFAPEAFRSKVKSPFELILSMRRSLGLELDPSTTSAALSGEIGQPMFGKETPDGWPETGSAWMTSGAMFNRVGLAMRISSGAIPALAPDSSATWSQLASAPFERQVDAVLRVMFAGNASPQTRNALNALKPVAGSNETPITGRETLQQLIAMAFSSPEFQHR